MKCVDCKFMEDDVCVKVNAFISEELKNTDLDCLIFNADCSFNYINIKDGKKVVEVELPTTLFFKKILP